jgi:hypothetical protein
MTTMTAAIAWPARAEAWLDQRGRGAWIAAMVLGFILFWPIGLALLAYMIWGKKMFGRSCKTDGMHRHNRHHPRSLRESTGNSAFDSYRADTLRRLEDEQAAFHDFLDRLRKAKDQTEFDAFMDDRARRRREATEAPEAPAQG